MVESMNITDTNPSGLEIFLASVSKVYSVSEDFGELKTDIDYTLHYNGNKSFDKKDSRFLGAIEFARNSPIVNENYGCEVPEFDSELEDNMNENQEDESTNIDAYYVRRGKHDLY